MALTAAAIQKIDASRGFAGIAGMTNPSARLVILADIVLYNKSTEAEVTIGACYARPAWNGSGAPAGVQYVPRLIAPAITQTVLNGGQPTFSSLATWGEFSLVDIDGYYRGNNATSTDYLDRAVYEWRRVTLRVGVNPDAYGDFEVIDSYRFVGPPASDGVLVTLQSGAALLNTEAPAYDARYHGFDTALDSDDGTLHVTSGNSDANLAADEDLYVRLGFKAPASASSMVLFSTRAALGAGNDGMTAYLNSSGNLVFSIADGSAEFTVSDSGTYDDGTRYDAAFWVDRDSDELKGEVTSLGGSVAAFTTDAVDVSTLGAVTNTNQFRTHEFTGGSTPLTGYVDELVIKTGSGLATRADFADLRKAHREGPASIREVGGQYHWPMDEDNGTAVQNGYDAKLEAAVDHPLSDCVTGSAANREIDFGNNYNRGAADSFANVIVARILGTATAQGLLGKKTAAAAANAGYLLYVDASDNLVGLLSDGTDQATTSGAITTGDGVVRGYAMTVDRTFDQLRIWESDSSLTVWTQIGSTADTSAVDDTTDAGANLVAGEFSGGAQPLNGDIYAIHVYSGTVLTTAKMAQLAPIYPSQADNANLASFYPIDEGTSTTINDAVGSVDGTMGAGGSWKTRDGTVTPGTAAGWVATLTGSYANGVGGTSKGQVYGQVDTIAPVLIDHRGHDHTADGGFSDSWVYEWHDGPDDCQAVSVVTVGGVAATLNTDYKVSSDNKRIFWDASTSAPGGPVRIGGLGAKFNSGAYSNRLGLITREWMTTNGLLTTGEFPAATASDFDADWPYPVGVYIRGGLARPETAATVLRRSLPAPGLMWSTDMEGDTFLMGRSLHDPSSETADVTLTDKVLAARPEVTFPARPVYRVSVGYAEQVDPLSEGDFLADATETTKDRFSQRFSYAVAVSSTVTAEDGRELVIDTPLVNHADALAWAQIVLAALDGGMSVQVELARHLWQVFVLREGRSRPDVVSLQSDYAAGLGSALNFSVLGYDYTPARVSSGIEVALELWRP